MKRIRLFAALVCCVATLALPVTPALPAGAAEAQIYDNFVYSVETTPAGYSYVAILGYIGNAAELTVPGEIDGVPVEYIDSLRGNEKHCPKRLVISEGVKAIRTLFDLYNAELQEVVLPDTLKVLGGSERLQYWHTKEECYFSSGVFAYATSLKTLKVPYSVALMSENTFHKDITLQVEAGTYAEQWAKANDQPFEMIEHAPSVGDYDADGLTTTTDARLLLQQTADKVAFRDEQLAVADVDGDGKITTTDARLTLQYAAGKEAVDSLACPLTFESPLIPKEAVTEVTGWVKAPAQSGAPFDYTRAPGPLTNPAVVLDHLNACVDKEYRAAPSYAMSYYGAGVSMYVNGVRLSYQQDHCLRYYGLMFTVGTGSPLTDLVMA